MIFKGKDVRIFKGNDVHWYRRLLRSCFPGDAAKLPSFTLFQRISNFSIFYPPHNHSLAKTYLLQVPILVKRAINEWTSPRTLFRARCAKNQGYVIFGRMLRSSAEVQRFVLQSAS